MSEPDIAVQVATKPSGSADDEEDKESRTPRGARRYRKGKQAKERVAMVPGRKAQEPAPGEGSSYERTRGKDDGTLEGEVPAVVKPDPRQQKVSHPPTLEIDGLAFERDGRRR